MTPTWWNRRMAALPDPTPPSGTRPRRLVLTSVGIIARPAARSQGRPWGRSSRVDRPGRRAFGLDPPARAGRLHRVLHLLALLIGINQMPRHLVGPSSRLMAGSS